MSASDDQATAAEGTADLDTKDPETAEGKTSADRETSADQKSSADEAASPDVEPSTEEESSDGADVPADDAPDEGESAAGMTPKQARRLRVAVASVLLVAMAVVLVVRLASRTSVLVVGVYGLAMILCGVVIELSRNGRTRLGTWLLAGGLLAALAADWLILP
ncbi:hypothetical protein ABZO31_08855 [Streptomyces sp. HUAS MG47]|uniref:hypothetical protein n=1 Tax=Streptomyces solicamelliae TaxID=3231716 RepID=UPI003877FFAC